MKTNIGIGKEMPKLKPAKVKIVDVESVEVQGKAKPTESYEKVVLHVEHPEKDELIAIDKMKYEQRGKLTIKTLWYTEDSDGNVAHDSALAVLMRYLKVGTISELVGKEIDTAKDENDFLIIKAY